MELEIQPARPEDAEPLTQIALAAKGYWGYPDRWMRLWAPELTVTPEYILNTESWTASIDHQLVGFYTLLESEGNAWLANLWVMPAQIGTGVGSLLFQHAMCVAKKRGYRLLRLESDPNAVGFYTKMSMRQIGERHYEIEGQPRYLPIMEIEL